jgi:hypothetical protein
MDILMATNDHTRHGVLYDVDGSGSVDAMERTLRTMANEVYSAMNEQGHI